MAMRKPPVERLPPHSIEAEQGVLGSILGSPEDCLRECALKLKPGHLAFYDVKHQAIFLAMMALYSQGSGVDVVTTFERLRTNKSVQEAGGLAYLAGLPDKAPTPMMLAYHMDIVLEKYKLRKLMQTCTGIVGRIYDHEGDSKDFLASCKVDLEECLNGHKKGFPPIQPAAILCADDSITLPPEIIKGVFHQGLKGVLGSGSKARKTWILLDLAISVSTGTPFWQFQTVMGRVLYINFEIPEPFIRWRIMQLAAARGTTSLADLHVWNLRGKSASFGKMMPSLLDHIGIGKYSLVIIDPIYKGLGGRDENSAGDIGELCNELEQIPAVSGAGLIYGAHYSKGNQAGKEAIDRIGGSGVWTRDADSIITLTAHEQEDCYTVDMVLRNLPPVAPFVTRWGFPRMMVDGDLSPEDLKQAKGRPSEHTEEDLLDLLPETGLTGTDWKRAALDKMSKNTFYRLRDKLAASGRAFDSLTAGKWMPNLKGKT
jgi:hypothetical protein